MSRGITFKLLKKSKATVSHNYLKKLISQFEEKHKGDVDIFSNVDTESPRHPRYMDSCVDSFDLLESETCTPYNIALGFTFNSTFHEIREYFEEYGLNSYSYWNSSINIDKNTAKNMLVAIDYILIEHYDEKIETAMRNDFIKVFGSLSGAYKKYEYMKMFPNDNSGDYEDFRESLEDVKSMLVAFLNCDNHENYKFVVEAWG